MRSELQVRNRPLQRSPQISRITALADRYRLFYLLIFLVDRPWIGSSKYRHGPRPVRHHPVSDSGRAARSARRPPNVHGVFVDCTLRQAHFVGRSHHGQSLHHLHLQLMPSISTFQFERDVMVWNHKTYIERPVLVAEDKTLAKHRRWFQQFYSENSPRLGSQKDNYDW